MTMLDPLMINSNDMIIFIPTSAIICVKLWIHSYNSTSLRYKEGLGPFLCVLKSIKPLTRKPFKTSDYTKSIQYVGVIWYVFLVHRLLLIKFTSSNMCCINKSMMKHQQKSYWVGTSPDLVMVIESTWCLLIFNWIQVGPPNNIHCWT